MSIVGLVIEFSSLVDEALILSICSDFDLDNPEDYQTARQALITLSENVPFEEATGFNASGLGAQQYVDINAATHVETSKTQEVSVECDLRSNDGHTTTTESSIPHSIVSAASSKSSSREAYEAARLGIFDGQSNDETMSGLQSMFPQLKPIDIKLALQKFNGDADRAVEVLLNTAHLEQTGQRAKGVDGFYHDEGTAQGKRKKGKRKKPSVRASGTSTPGSTNSSDEAVGTEETHRRNTSYLSERLPFSEAEIGEIYYQKSHSIGASLVQILDNFIAFDIDSANDTKDSTMEEQAKKFPWIPDEYMKPVFSLTSSRHHAMDLIHILANYYEKPAYLKYDISYSVAAPRLDTEIGGVNPNKPWAAVAQSNSPVSPNWSRASTPLSATTTRSSDLTEMRNHSFNAAGAAYKKGGLYRSAAAVHAERGRELTRDIHLARSSEAALRVDQTSRPDQIDLHGVTVQDGVGIALDRVWQWWENLGEDRARKAREGFTIVTGLGRHSTGGISRLRVNVFKALVADGWKVTVLTGQYLVTGRK